MTFYIFLGLGFSLTILVMFEDESVKKRIKNYHPAVWNSFNFPDGESPMINPHYFNKLRAERSRKISLATAEYGKFLRLKRYKDLNDPILNELIGKILKLQICIFMCIVSMLVSLAWS